MSLPGQLAPIPRLLLGPGPSDAHPRVLTAMTTPLLGHLDPQFLQIMDETKELLRQTFQTKNAVTLPMSATGMAGMETCLVNLIEPGDKVVTCAAGFFGNRFAEVAGRHGAQITVMERPWGEVFDPGQVRETVAKVRPKVLCMVQAETSTGAWQPIEQIGAICREFDVLFVLDTVTSLGCVPLAVDGWGVDAAYSCSQKGLGCPPGMSPVTFSERAVAAIKGRKTKTQSWYLRSDAASEILGRGSVVSPHGASVDDFRTARGIAHCNGRGPASALGSAHAQPSRRSRRASTRWA